jgi:LSD1 subclass zinc finger protein
MSDFITLKCPSCGAALQATPGTLSLRCSSCGNEHIVRHEGGAVLLESYARCPRCGRNDRSEKASGVLPEWDKYFYLYSQEVSSNVNAQMPRAPRYSSIDSKYIDKLGIFILVTIICCITTIIVLILCLNDTLYFSMFYITFILCLAIIILIFKLLHTRARNRSDRQYQLSAQQYEQNIKEWTQQSSDADYFNNRMLMRWDALYYCRRDDCYFIPSEGTWCSASQINQYILSGNPVVHR